MTVSKTHNRKDYTAGAPPNNKTYAFDFKIYDEADLLVYVNGALKVLGINYTVSGGPTWSESGGNVVFVASLVAGDAVLIYRQLTETQGTHWPEGDPFPSASHENAADRLVMLAQQFKETIGRVFKVVVSSLLTEIEVPEGAGKLWGWNAAGDGAAVYNQTIDTGVITTKGDLVVGGVGGIPERKAIGTDGQLATVAGGTVTWAVPAVVKLDDAGIPDDNTDLDASATQHGLCPKLAIASLATLMDLIYPVGSIYISIVATNPNTLFGIGTWVAFGAGRVLVGLDAGQAEFDTVEESDGAKTVSIAHVHAGPSHTHTLPTILGYDGVTANYQLNATATGVGGTGATGAMSANDPHSNLQPYIVVYMWKRTA